ncbi:MAG TPA: M23 family metallopeptidase [Verrucomicrobiae bacterium]|nr:M23 family metallopeptidase [Verrucomicrobiae bacterium]
MRTLFFLFAVASAFAARAQMFILPTANRALLNDGALSEKYLVGTTGKPWPSGGFGCVRSEGLKMHEGLDIRCTQRDKEGEPIDPVFAAAAGTIVYFSTKPSLSNYGRYIVIRHNIEGLQVCTLYAHLREVQDTLAIGQQVKQGQRIATMGRSTNTREGISKDRAHLHFEINFALSDHYAEWHKKYRVGQRNDHGDWNGQNLAAVEPTPILLGAARDPNFSLVKHLQSRREVFRVIVRDTNFSFLRNNPGLVKANPAATSAGIAGYEIALDFNGAPIELIPRAATELKSMSRIRVVGINDAELSKHRCSKLLTVRKGRRELSNSGEQRVNLLTY